MGTPADYGPMTEIQMHQEEIDEVVSQISKLSSDGLMVEWGSGGSTVKWLETMKDDQKLISIEHNKEWYDKVHGYIQTRDDIKDRFTYHFEGEKYGFKHGYASVLEEHPHGLDQYFLPDDRILDADIFFIDGIGRATVSLLVNFLAHKDDAVVYIHDYYGREHWYSWATQFFSEREKVGSTLVRLHM